MSTSLIIHTLIHLRPIQLFYQFWYRLFKSSYIAVEAPICTIPKLKTDPVPRHKSLEGNIFTFLNQQHEFTGWDFTGNGMLWNYNQNYFDWLTQKNMTAETGCLWIDKFITETSLNSKSPTLHSFDPYPIALRSINWIKFFCKYPDYTTKSQLNSLYSQVKLLEKKLEYHLMGNHLMEDAFALYISSVFFHDVNLYKKTTKLLLAELKEQILPDGGHYEQSPMYHCILLDRLLDCINITENIEYSVEGSENNIENFRLYATRMLGWLKSICYQDGTYPLFNDSAKGIAPDPAEIIDYANRLGIESDATPLGESGYRKMSNNNMEAFVDIGNIAASYQPGHSHADTFNFELRIGGKSFIVDTGISTYNKTERRQYERSTVAHNTVTVNKKNSSEVWGGFRIGRRARVFNEKQTISNKGIMVEASHNGFGKLCKRKFEMTTNEFIIDDWFDGTAISHVHLAENINPNIEQKDVNAIIKNDCLYSTEYNKFHKGTVIEMHFTGHLRFVIHEDGQVFVQR